MSRILLIAGNVFRGILSRRALFIWAIALVIMAFRVLPAFFLQLDEPAFRAYIQHTSVSEALGMWSVLSIASALFLGAATVSSEITSKLIVVVLARPIHRWELLIGKWLGVCAFAMVTMAIGVAIFLGLASFLNLSVSYRALAIALAQTTAAIIMLGGLATAISSVASTGLAAAVTVLLVFFPPLIDSLRAPQMSARSQRWGRALDVVTPAGYSSQYSNVAWAPRPLRTGRGTFITQERPAIDYKEQRKIVFENTAFGAGYLLLGALFFTRRDMKAS